MSKQNSSANVTLVPDETTPVETKRTLFTKKAKIIAVSSLAAIGAVAGIVVLTNKANSDDEVETTVTYDAAVTETLDDLTNANKS